jgi:hypothetical protein
LVDLAVRYLTARITAKAKPRTSTESATVASRSLKLGKDGQWDGLSNAPEAPGEDDRRTELSERPRDERG